jgi:hypothetical protein
MLKPASPPADRDLFSVYIYSVNACFLPDEDMYVFSGLIFSVPRIRPVASIVFPRLSGPALAQMIRRAGPPTLDVIRFCEASQQICHLRILSLRTF